MDKPSFYGIIPANVRYAQIADRAKLIFSEITALANKHGYCNASNGFFAEVWGCDPSVISRHISTLEKAGFVRIEYLREGKQIIERRIYPVANGGVLHGVQGGIAPDTRGVLHDMQGGIACSIKENNTSKNITSININKVDSSESKDAHAEAENEKKESKENLQGKMVTVWEKVYLDKVKDSPRKKRPKEDFAAVADFAKHVRAELARKGESASDEEILIKWESYCVKAWELDNEIVRANFTPFTLWRMYDRIKAALAAKKQKSNSKGSLPIVQVGDLKGKGGLQNPSKK